MPAYFIDLDKLDKEPIDITKHIHKFIKYMNVSWPVLHELMDEHEWADDPEFTLDFTEALWIFLVERILLGWNRYLYMLHEGSKYNMEEPRVINPTATPGYLVAVKLKKDSRTHFSKKLVPNIPKWILDDFQGVKLNEKGEKISADQPPFEVVILRNESRTMRAGVSIDDVQFFLEKL